MKRLAVANICCFFAADVSDLLSTPLPEEMRFAELESDMLRKFQESHPDTFNGEHTELLQRKNVRGFVVTASDGFAGVVWIATESVPGSINHDGHPATELPLYLPKNTAYLFSVFVPAEHRGRRLYPVMVSQLADRLQTSGIRQFVLTTEASNDSALRSVNRMGFRRIGRSMLFGAFGWVIALYPEQPLPGGVTLGHYAGDKQR
jgi:ribosomal protein S18 acetylase RimI-like enzyme